MSTKTKTEYCHYSESQIRESGLLSPERMEQVESEVTARILPCFDQKGREVQQAKIADLGEQGLMLFARVDSESVIEYLRRSILPVVLTAAELELVNRDCTSARARALDAQRFANAKKVEAWDGGAWLGDTYFQSMDDLCDHLECEGEEWPEYVWAAQPKVIIPSLDVSDVVEHHICDRGWEDMDTDDLNGVAELQAALDRFTEANASVKSYEPDHTTAILLAPWKAA